ncbi:hypothetical protein [Nocardia farcinica]|uniref:NERD domain-containing protein n=1 Tax=Nocardia farcinica (strain IFM 10152) TaxID=247156 RepID=Q5YV51_NOCFA|nr:hypothetical protein [Nocardia farcinica]BAD57940.1 hypothetical protein NFA_30930 [Nocardia farcinica IFM 10152]
MYFTGLEHFGGDFPELVGCHLQLLEPIGAQVYPEIRYGHEGKLTCDSIVVLPGLVLLVETKSLRSIEVGRRLEPTDVPTATTSAHDFEQVLATLLPLPDAATRILEALTAKPPHHPPVRSRATAFSTKKKLTAPVVNKKWRKSLNREYLCGAEVFVRAGANSKDSAADGDRNEISPHSNMGSVPGPMTDPVPGTPHRGSRQAHRGGSPGSEPENDP